MIYRFSHAFVIFFYTVIIRWRKCLVLWYFKIYVDFFFKSMCILFKVQCETLVSVAGGSLVASTDGVNTKVEYSCDTGYTINGKKEITCNSDGSWDSAQSSCSKYKLHVSLSFFLYVWSWLNFSNLYGEIFHQKEMYCTYRFLNHYVIW